MKKVILKLSSFILILKILSSPFYGQTDTCYGIIEDLGPNLKSQECQGQSPNYLNFYRHQSNWIPLNVNSFNTHPLKELNIEIHIIQKSDPNNPGNFSNNTTDLAVINQLFNFIDVRYRNINSPTDPVNCVCGNDCLIQDSKLGLNITGIYFHQNDSYWDNFGLNWSSLQVDYYSLPIYLIGGDGASAGGNAFTPSFNNLNYSQRILFSNVYSKYILTGDIWGTSQTLGHEIAHTLGLLHTYAPTCCHESCSESSLDYLSDVFGTTNGNCKICHHDWQWNTDPSSPSNSATNNIVGGTADQSYISPMQLGRIHRNLSLSSIRRYVSSNSYDNSSYNITSDETWDFSMRFYKNITIKSGNTLTLKCELFMPENGKIIIEPNAKLIVDGGKISNFHENFWLGIDVQGNKNLHQTETNQGVVELKNGALIEYAKNGIRTIGTDEIDNKDWNKTGGIVRVYEATFKNCWRGIEFLSYKNMNPTGNGQEMPNISFINNADFITTEALPNNLSPYCGISMFEIKGVKVIKCNFENTRSDIATIPYTERGSGIYSHDATYKVAPSYNINTGVPILASQNTFKNLYFGMSTGGSSSLSSVTVKDNYFENCIFGVSLSGANYSIIGKNTINVGDRDPNTYSIGIHTRGAYGYNIEQNTISRHLGSTFQNQGVHTAINQPFASAKVYKNNITNTTFGNQTANGNSTTKVDCNQYTKGSLSTIDFHHASGTLGPQGSNIGTPAYNQFIGACNNSLLAQIYRNPNANSFIYNYSTQTNSLNPNCTNLSLLEALPNNTINLNVCGSSLSTEVITEKPIKLAQVKTSLGEVKSEITTTNNLIDGGNTQNLINLINNTNIAAWQVDQTLQAASPYLSDAVLLAMINRTPKLPDWVVDNVLQANGPLQSEVLLAVISKTYPDWVLSAALTHSAPVSSTVLLSLIDSNYPAWLTNTVLKQHSPLFDNVLVAMINQTNLPDWANNEVLLLNTPLSQEVNDAMNNRIPSFPTWMINQINNHTYQAPNPVEPTPVVSVTDEIQRTLQYLKRERLDLTDQVVRIYIDTLWIDSVVVFLEQEGTIEAIQALVPIEMDRDTAKAKQHIATIEAHADSLELANANEADIDELRNFTKFQELLLELKTKEGSYYSMSPQQRRMLQEWSIKDLAIAPQAQAILDFVNEKLPIFDGEDAFFPKNMTEEESEQLINQETKNGYQFSVSPNPSNGFVAFTLESDNLENMEIVITDMQGKIIKILTVDNLRINYEFINIPYGVYLAHLTKNGVIQNTQKALYVK